MSSRPLRRIQSLGSKYIDLLERNQIRTYKDLLSKTDIELQLSLDIGYETLRFISKPSLLPSPLG